MSEHFLWQTWATVQPDQIALITPDTAYSWQTLTVRIHALANSLSQQGVQPGTVVTAVGKNAPELVLLHLACLQLGAITALTMPQPVLPLREKLDVLYATEPNPKELNPKAQARFLWFSEQARNSFSEPDWQALTTDATLLDLAIQPEADCALSLSDVNAIASIIFTSGSSGAPKAVAHTQAQHLASARGLLDVFSFQQTDCWLLSLPMYHVSGLSILYRWLSAGACLKIGSGKLEDDIQGATHASLVATQLKRLLDQLEQPQPKRLKLSHVLLGGSDVPLPLCQQAAQWGIETWLGYGMTEAASTVTAKQVDAVASAGRVLPNRLVQLRHNRIYIGGQTLASGYYHQGQLTPLNDAQGWFDTKDLGLWVDGELRIIGRADNQFISGGENIHCEEIEAVLNRHPAIHQSIVIPVACDEYGARPIALIDAAEDLSTLNLPHWLASQLDRFKIPDAFYPMPKLPQAGIKVSRQAMQDWFADHAGEARLIKTL
ncbi:o-succinylbenzoate--CoA ligase [Photobacterium sp. R1]